MAAVKATATLLAAPGLSPPSFLPPYPQLPNLPLVGKGPAQKPLPTFEVRVSTAGEIEVLVQGFPHLVIEMPVYGC